MVLDLKFYYIIGITFGIFSMKNILVLDDEHNVTMLVQGILSTYYYRSASIPCPPEAQQRLPTRKFNKLKESIDRDFI